MAGPDDMVHSQDVGELIAKLGGTVGGESDSILSRAELEDSLRLLCVAQRSQVSHKFLVFCHRSQENEKI